MSLNKNLSRLSDPDSKEDQQPEYAKNPSRSIRKDLVVNIPESASKIVVKKLVEGIEKDISDKVVVMGKERLVELEEHNLVTGGVVVEFNEGLFDKIIALHLHSLHVKYFCTLFM